MSLILSTPPASEPIDLATAKAHLHLDGSDSDTEVTAMIKAARERAEMYLGKDLVKRTWVYGIDGFPGESKIGLPKSPVISVDSITYIDTDGNSQTLADSVYEVDAGIEPGEVYLDYDQEWPATRDQRLAVTITFDSGHSAIPQAINSAILLYLGDLFENRESSSQLRIQPLPTAENLLKPYRRRNL